MKAKSGYEIKVAKEKRIPRNFFQVYKMKAGEELRTLKTANIELVSSGEGSMQDILDSEQILGAEKSEWVREISVT